MKCLLQLILILSLTGASTSFTSPWLYKLVKSASEAQRRTQRWHERWNRVERYIIKYPTADIDFEPNGMPSARVLIRFFNSSLYQRHYAGILAYDKVGDLGEGHFGIVNLARYRPTGELVAVKTLSKKQFKEERLSFPPLEPQLMEGLKHPNIVRMLRSFKNDAAMFLITEYAEGMELFNYVRERTYLSEGESRQIMLQVLDAIAYLHSKGIAHRDLKLENIIIDAVGKVTILDLGLGNFCGPHTLLTTHCGSRDYTSPELWGLRAYNGHAADVWSLGVILYMLVTGCVPFNTSMEIVSIDYKWPKYTPLSNELKHLIWNIFKPAHERYSIQDILKHPWMARS